MSCLCWRPRRETVSQAGCGGSQLCDTDRAGDCYEKSAADRGDGKGDAEGHRAGEPEISHVHVFLVLQDEDNQESQD